MNPDQRGQFSLKLIQKCPVCNHDYSGGRIEILTEADQGFLAYMSCGFCASSIIVRVLTLPHGLVGNAILTDLNNTEVLSYGSTIPVAGDQVLAFHEMINLEDSGMFMEKIRNN